MKKFCEKCGSRMSIKLSSVNTRLNHGIFTYKASCITDLKRRRKLTILALVLCNIVIAVGGSVLLLFSIPGIILGSILIIAMNFGIVELIQRFAPVETDFFNANFAVDLSKNHEDKADY